MLNIITIMTYCRICHPFYTAHPSSLTGDCDVHPGQTAVLRSPSERGDLHVGRISCQRSPHFPPEEYTIHLEDIVKPIQCWHERSPDLWKEHEKCSYHLQNLTQKYPDWNLSSRKFLKSTWRHDHLQVVWVDLNEVKHDLLERISGFEWLRWGRRAPCHPPSWYATTNPDLRATRPLWNWDPWNQNITYPPHVSDSDHGRMQNFQRNRWSYDILEVIEGMGFPCNPHCDSAMALESDSPQRSTTTWTTSQLRGIKTSVGGYSLGVLWFHQKIHLKLKLQHKSATKKQRHISQNTMQSVSVGERNERSIKKQPLAIRCL